MKLDVCPRLANKFIVFTVAVVEHHGGSDRRMEESRILSDSPQSQDH